MSEVSQVDDVEAREARESKEQVDEVEARNSRARTAAWNAFMITQYGRNFVSKAKSTVIECPKCAFRFAIDRSQL